MEQDTQTESTGSEARRIFEAQSRHILRLLNGILHDVEQINDPVDAIHSILAPTSAMVDGLSKDPSEANLTSSLADISTNVGMLHEHVDEIRSRIQANMQIHPFLFDWMLAMMVTFAEAYLENVLLLLTTRNPKWMATNERVISGDDVMKIEAEPPETRWQRLLEIMRQRWATQFLREKPGVWISRLEKFGVPKYRAGLREEMADIWKRRHEIVHASPQSTGMGESETARYIRSKSEFSHSVSLINSFVDATDAFVVANC